MLTSRSWWMILAMLAKAATGRGEIAATLTMDISALRALPARQVTALTAEAASIWRPYGVAIRWSRVPVMAASDMSVLSVVDGARGGGGGRTRGPREELGAVEFRGGQAVADPVIYLGVEAITSAVLRAPVHGRAVYAWPPRFADEIVGRALGRVVAHEIGHYLLALRSHTDGGLMRAAFTPFLLTTATGGDLEVPQLLLPRLRARLREIGAPQEAHRSPATQDRRGR